MRSHLLVIVSFVKHMLSIYVPAWYIFQPTANNYFHKHHYFCLSADIFIHHCPPNNLHFTFHFSQATLSSIANLFYLSSFSTISCQPFSLSPFPTNLSINNQLQPTIFIFLPQLIFCLLSPSPQFFDQTFHFLLQSHWGELCRGSFVASSQYCIRDIRHLLYWTVVLLISTSSRISCQIQLCKNCKMWRSLHTTLAISKPPVRPPRFDLRPVQKLEPTSTVLQNV